jgi:hypothetical protein
MTVLFLDDCPRRTKKFKSRWPSVSCYKTSAEIIEAIKTAKRIDVIFLDHDLGGEFDVDTNSEDCGMTVVRYIEKNKPSIGNIVIHSLNPTASVEMYARLKAEDYRVNRIKFIDFNKETYGYFKAFKKIRDDWSDKNVRSVDKKKRKKELVAPGKVINVEMAHRIAFCTVLWANGNQTEVRGDQLEIIK